MDDVKGRLASSLGQRDETPNIVLAEAIAAAGDQAAVACLADLLKDKNKDLRSDSIKVLYEIGARRPGLLRPHLDVLLALLSTKDNRLQWGLMTALATLVSEDTAAIYQALPLILDIAAKGSVITKDQCVRILLALCQSQQYRTEALVLLLEQLRMALPNQLPMYAEQALPLIDAAHKTVFTEVLEARMEDIEKDSKKKRVEKVIGSCKKIK